MSNVPSASQFLSRNEKEGLTTQFKVIISGFRDMSFKSCEGIECEIDVRSYPEGGRNGAPRTARGLVKVNRISFSQGSAGSGGKSLYDWFQDVCDLSKPLRKESFHISVVNNDGQGVSEWWVQNAWPCRWMAPLMTKDTNQLTVDYVSFAHEGIERKK